MPSSLSPPKHAEPLIVQCQDGFPLEAHLHRDTTIALKGAVLLAPATGFKQTFYFNFAQWLAKQGYAVLTYDNRGIGQSTNNLPLAQQTANLIDWGTLDLPAALDELLSQTNIDKPVYFIGHSAGAQLIGLMPNHSKIHRFLLVGASSGYFGNLSHKTRLQAQAVFKLWMPISNLLLGYASTATIGFGENLPKNVAKQWLDWCSSPGYVENDFGRGIKQHYYSDIWQPILCLTATDDHIATPANVADFTRLLPNSKLDERFVKPSHINLDHIGHSDWFRKRCSDYWPAMLAWLETQ